MLFFPRGSVCDQPISRLIITCYETSTDDHAVQRHALAPSMHCKLRQTSRTLSGAGHRRAEHKHPQLLQRQRTPPGIEMSIVSLSKLG